ncbi:hypothetical protein [Luteolibacter sp. LG18]|uniref:hypothetical protein n=1 Tax=Luteolibacter sp. LG18 TaxID=2819286 RepID=UPI0030C6CB31
MATSLATTGYQITTSGSFYLDTLFPGVEYLLCCKSDAAIGSGSSEITLSQPAPSGTGVLLIDDGALNQATPKTEARFVAFNRRLNLDVGYYSGPPIQVICLPIRRLS